MRVKIGDRWYNSKDDPICVELSSREKRIIPEMEEDVHHFAVYRSGARESDDVYRWCEARNATVWERDHERLVSKNGWDRVGVERRHRCSL